MQHNDGFDDLITDYKIGGAGGTGSGRPSERGMRRPTQQRRAYAGEQRQLVPARETQTARSAAAPQVRHAAAPRVQVPQQRAGGSGRRPQEPYQGRSEHNVEAAARLAQGGSGGNRGWDDDDDYEEEPEDSGSGLGRWAKALLVLVLALAASVFLAFFALQSASDLFGLEQPDNEIDFVLPENLSMSEIAHLLKEKGVITQSLVFQLYAGLSKEASDFIPGNYALNSNMGYDQIISKFITGSKILVEVRLTFYEGMTLSEIANRLEEGNVCKAEDLYEYLESGELPDYDFLQGIPDSPNRFRALEGYFFPDTYNFYEDMGPKMVVSRFFNNFSLRMDEELQEKMKAHNLTIDQTITLASIIQREAGDPEQMAMVSSVFHNRLSSDSQLPKLQSDVTRDYVNNYIKPFLSDAVDKEKNPDAVDPNQAMYDAYNTYVCNGLPIGPVCNPGLDAIRAALEPAQSNYYYFVTDEEGQYYYATTQAEHDQNVQVAANKGKVHGTDADHDVVA